MATQALNDAEITQRLEQSEGWERDGNQIVKTYQFDSYLAGIAFASAIGILAEGHDHHPNLQIGWRKVVVQLSTHDAGNAISVRDFELADAIDALPYPG